MLHLKKKISFHWSIYNIHIVCSNSWLKWVAGCEETLQVSPTKKFDLKKKKTTRVWYCFYIQLCSILINARNATNFWVLVLALLVASTKDFKF